MVASFYLVIMSIVCSIAKNANFCMKHPVLSVVERANIRFVYNNVTLMQIKVHQKDVAGKRVQVCKMTLMAMVVANNSVVIMGWQQRN